MRRPLKLDGEFMWTIEHRQRGPVEHNDPPGYQFARGSESEVATPHRQYSWSWGFRGGYVTYEQLQEVNNIIVGSPQTVIRKLTEVIERLSPGYLHIYGNEGDMPHASVMRSIELLGKEVIPALHEIKLQPYE